MDNYDYDNAPCVYPVLVFVGITSITTCDVFYTSQESFNANDYGSDFLAYTPIGSDYHYA